MGGCVHMCLCSLKLSMPLVCLILESYMHIYEIVVYTLVFLGSRPHACLSICNCPRFMCTLPTVVPWADNLVTLPMHVYMLLLSMLLLS